MNYLLSTAEFEQEQAEVAAEAIVWQSPEQLHLFSGQHLSVLVEKKGFTAVDYTVDPTSKSGMVVCAFKEKKK